MAKIADLIVNLSANVAEFRTSMNQASEDVRSLHSTILDAGAAVKDFLAGFVGYETIKRSIDATTEWADSIERMTEVTGLSAQASSALTASAREQGVQIESLNSFLQRLYEAVARTPQRFSELGISIRDASGNLLPMETIARNTIDTLDQFKVGSDRTAAAMSLLGRAGAQSVAEFSRFRDTLDATNMGHAAELVRAFGLEMDENGIRKARDWEHAEADLGLALLGVENISGRALLPVIKDLADDVTRLAESGELQRWADEATRGVLELTKAFLELADVVAQHNQIVGITLGTLGGVAALTSPSATGRAAGLAAFVAGWKLTGTGADEAAAKTHAALQKMIGDISSAESKIGEVNRSED